MDTGRLFARGPHLIDGSRRIVAIGKAGFFSAGECYENVSRLALCWNACNGIATRALQNMLENGAAISGLIVLTRRLAGQCDDLVSTLRELHAAEARYAALTDETGADERNSVTWVLENARANARDMLEKYPDVEKAA